MSSFLRWNAGLAVIAVIILLSSSLSDAKVYDVQVQDAFDFNWAFLTKFCFDHQGPTNPGIFSYSLTSATPSNLNDIAMAIYDDQTTSWSDFYDAQQEGSLTCQASLQYTKAIDTLTVDTIYINETTRPHFWYIAITRCADNSFDSMEIHMEFLNPGGFFKRQFSYDEQGILELYIVYCTFYALTGTLFAKALLAMRRTQSLHPLIMFFAAGFFATAIGCFFNMIHFIKYASDGFGIPGLRGLGGVLITLAEAQLIFTLLLLAKGWTISRPSLENKRLLACIATTMLCLYITLFIWLNVGIDPASTVYTFDTPPGICLAVLHVPLLGLFLYWLRQTRDEEISETKKDFYKKLAVSFSAWFLVLPLIVIIAAGLDPWVRYIAATSINVTALFVAHIGMIFMLWPSRSAAYFKLAPGAAVAGALPYENL